MSEFMEYRQRKRNEYNEQDSQRQELRQGENTGGGGEGSELGINAYKIYNAPN